MGDELRRWWGDTRLELVEGGPFRLRWRTTDGHGEVATLERPHLLHVHRQGRSPDQDVPTAAGWHLHLDAFATTLAGDPVRRPGRQGWAVGS